MGLVCLRKKLYLTTDHVRNRDKLNWVLLMIKSVFISIHELVGMRHLFALLGPPRSWTIWLLLASSTSFHPLKKEKTQWLCWCRVTCHCVAVLQYWHCLSTGTSQPEVCCHRSWTCRSRWKFAVSGVVTYSRSSGWAIRRSKGHRHAAQATCDLQLVQSWKQAKQHVEYPSRVDSRTRAPRRALAANY